ncbi:MAG: HEAT repeat domain-containing protein [Pyrinomonadaceae bacterium]|nr:HEAT repeat domain-containing protein [Pyrinomonadaceae bacterium]
MSYSVPALLLAGLLCAQISAQTERELEVLSEQVSLGTINVKRNALLALGRLKSESASRIAEKALRDESEIVRATAIRTVIYLPPRDASSLVIPFLSAKSAFVRKEALFALADISDPVSANSVIAALLSDKDKEVRATAAYSLGRIGSPAAIDPLVSLLKKKPKKKRAFLRRSAARSIGQIAEALAGKEPSDSVPSDFILKGAISSAQGPIEPKMLTRVDVLIRVLSNPKEFADTRREAAFALGAIGSPRAKASLEKYSAGSDYILAQVCREALAKIG